MVPTVIRGGENSRWGDARMLTVRSCLSCVLLLALMALAGCRSVLNLPPAQEPRGGFSVLVGLPDQPTTERVFADVGTFAQEHGFVRLSDSSAPALDPATHQPTAPAPLRYLRGKIGLDVSYDAAHLRVVVSLHSTGSGGDRRFISQFNGGFYQQYVGKYGTGVLSLDDEADERSVPVRNSGRDGRGQR